MGARIFVGGVFAVLLALAVIQLAVLWPSITASYEEFDLEPVGTANLTAEGKAVRLHGLTIGSSGTVWVVDVQPPDQKILVLDAEGIEQSTFPSAAAAGITADGETVLAVFPDSPVMTRYARDGDVIEEIEVHAPGIFVPSGVTPGAEAGYVVTAAGSGRAYVLDQQGDQLAVLGINAAGMSQILDASYPAVDGEGGLYVSDRKGRVLRWDGEQLDATFTTRGRVPAVLTDPRGSAVDAQGRVWIADPVARRVWIFADDTTLLGWWMPPGAPAPIDVAVHRGRIYVSDRESPLVQWFTLPD